MPLLLSDEDVQAVLTMADSISALEDAYRQEGLGTAANRTKSTLYIHPQPDLTTQFLSMEGGLLHPPVFAFRIGSLVQERRGPSGAQLLALFSGETAEVLALLQAGAISAYRVGATAGLAAREMARRDARVVGVLGSGSMAQAHALAYATVRDIQEFKVYSPNPEHRAAFAEWVSERTGVPARALDGPEEVVRGSDIVAACTNSKSPIVKREWLDRPGVHATGVQTSGTELEPEALKGFHRFVAYMSGDMTHHHTEPGPRRYRLAGTHEKVMALYDPIPHHHTLVEVLRGDAPGRESDEENNYFMNEGTGVQFAALAALAYELALERGVGEEMPEGVAKWFR